MSANVNRVTLDTQSSMNLLSSTLNLPSAHTGETHLERSLGSFAGNTQQDNNAASNMTNLTSIAKATNVADMTTNTYAANSDTSTLINNNTDKAILDNPLRKLANEKLLKTTQNNTPTTASSFITTGPKTLTEVTKNQSTKTLTTNSSLTKESNGTQTVRKISSISPVSAKLNFSLSLNPYNYLTHNTSTNLPSSFYSTVESDNINPETSSRILSNRLTMNLENAPVLSNNPRLAKLDFDAQKAQRVSSKFNGNQIKTTVTNTKLANPYVLAGSDIGALDALRQPY
jgi:hypothetical protein